MRVVRAFAIVLACVFANLVSFPQPFPLFPKVDAWFHARAQSETQAGNQAEVPAETEVGPTVHDGRVVSYASIVDATAPAVVNIFAERVVRDSFKSPFANDPFFSQFFERLFPEFSQPRIENALGSGALIDGLGLIVTNDHVVSEGMDINVGLYDGRTVKARVVARSVGHDLAFLQLQNPAQGAFPFLEFGDSDDVLVGDIVLALGNPFGIGQTVTSGIVSGLGRSLPLQRNLRSLIQTDAAINPGNSGGPLVDMEGRIIGVNSAIFSSTGASIGVGFAIPANIVAVAARHAREGSPIRFSWPGLGVEAVSISRREVLNLPEGIGVSVTSVHEDGPAHRAGIHASDIITRVGEKAVTNPEQFRVLIQSQFPEGSVVVAGYRGAEFGTFNLSLEIAPEVPPANLTRIPLGYALGGLTVGNLSPALSEDLGLDDRFMGVVILRVDPRSPGQRLGLKGGDRIDSIDGAPIPDVKTLTKILGTGRAAHMIVDRSGKRYQLSIFR